MCFHVTLQLTTPHLLERHVFCDCPILNFCQIFIFSLNFDISEFYYDCDQTDGLWVKDTSLEYGKGILSNYTKCRVDHRHNCKRHKKDSTYLGERWVLTDKNCEANRIRFTRQRFLEKIKNRKVAFIGDSLTRNMFQSLACLLYQPNNRTKMIEDNMYRYRLVFIRKIYAYVSYGLFVLQFVRAVMVYKQGT